MIYTTNAVEALHRSLRAIIKTRGSFPNDDAALKLLYLAIRSAGRRWRRGIKWTASWVSWPFSSAKAFRERRDDKNGHHGNGDNRLARTFVVKSCGALRRAAARFRGLTARYDQANWSTVSLMPRSWCTKTKPTSPKSLTKNL